MYLNSVRRDWSAVINPQIHFRVSGPPFARRFLWVHIFTTTVHSRLSLSIHYLYIASEGEFARAADRLKAIRRLAFPGGRKRRKKGAASRVFRPIGFNDFFQRHSRDSAGRRTPSSLIRDASREACKALLRVSPATFLRWKFYIESKRKKYKSPTLAIKFPRDVFPDIVIRNSRFPSLPK